MKVAKSILRILILMVAVLIFSCKPLINKMAFHPDTTDLIETADLPAGVEEVYLTTEDETKIQGYYLADSDSDQLVIYFHGNAGNIGHRLDDLEIIKRFGTNVLGVGYRGYGKSDGKPSEEGIYLDGKAALEYAVTTRGFSMDKIIILGRSIGTTVAINTAQHKSLAGLILVTPLTSGKAHAKVSGMGVISFMAGDCFDNLSKIKNITSPLLVIHGSRDEVIPYEMGKTIFDAAECKKEFIAINGGHHNDISTRYEIQYWKPIKNFIHSCK